MAVTWNPSDKSACTTLSAGNLKATASAGGCGVRSTNYKSSGKWYVECLWETLGSTGGVWSFGMANSSAVLGNTVGSDANAWGFCDQYYGDGTKAHNGSGSAYYGSIPVSGDRIMMAVDLTAGKVWWGINGVWIASGDPANGTNEAFSGLSGNLYVMCRGAYYGAAPDQTVNFGGSAFTYSIPSGFSAWDAPIEVSITEGVSLGDTFDGNHFSENLIQGILLGDTFTDEHFVGALTEGILLGDTLADDHFVVALTEGAKLGDTLTAAHTFFKALTEGARLGDSIVDEHFVGALLEGILLGDDIGAAGTYEKALSEGTLLGDTIADNHYVEALTEGIKLGEALVRTLEVTKALTEGVVLGDDIEGLNWTQWLEENAEKSVKRYYLTLTGDADGTTDIEIPMKSFQGRLRDGDPTWLSCVVPGIVINGVDYAAEINARSNGDLKVEMAYVLDGEVQQRETLVEVDFEEIVLYEGSINESITLTGHRTETFVPKTVLLDNSTYYSLNDGKILYRYPEPDLFLRPGDTVETRSDTFTVGLITYFIDVGRPQMQLTEA